MKRILAIEIAVILVLVAAAIFIRTGSSPKQPDTIQTEQTGQSGETEQTRQTVETTAPEQTVDVLATDNTQPTQTLPAPTWMAFPEDRQYSAQEYFVYDCDTGEFLVISSDPDTQVEPASITKLFTAYVAMQYLEPDAVITCYDALHLVVPGSSTAHLDWAYRLTVEQLVEAMLLPSGNDAAYVLAVEAGRIIDGKPNENASVAAQSFVEEMNRQAKELGMTGTHYVNPDGIHRESHISTLHDLALLGALAIENETIMKYASVTKDVVTMKSGQELEWENTNALINPESEYYCPYARGLKTGQTPYAGSCLLSAFDYEGRNLVIGVFGCAQTDDRFADTLQLFNETMGFAYLEESRSEISGE